jgi:hypothetical protein
MCIARRLQLASNREPRQSNSLATTVRCAKRTAAVTAVSSPQAGFSPVSKEGCAIPKDLLARLDIIHDQPCHCSSHHAAEAHCKQREQDNVRSQDRLVETPIDAVLRPLPAKYQKGRCCQRWLLLFSHHSTSNAQNSAKNESAHT